MSQTVASLLYQDGTSLLYISSLFLFILALKWLLFKRKANQQYMLPPSPFTLPIIGNLHQLGLLPHRSLALLAQRYGSVMLLHLGNKRTLVVSSASAAEEIMKTHDACFASRPDLRVMTKLSYDAEDAAIAPYGERWRYMRSLLVQHILSPKRVQSYRAIREEATLLMMRKIEGSMGDPVDLSELLSLLPIGILCKVALGKNYCEGSGGKFRELLSELSALSGAFDIGDSIPWLGWLNNFNGINSRVEKVFRSMDKIFSEIIEDHIAARSLARSDEQMDAVDILLEIERKSSTDGPVLTRKQIKGLMLDMFLGGTESTWTTMEWAMTELVRHPEIMKKAQREIRSIVGNKDEVVVTAEDIAQMDYLKAVIKETYRFHPPGPFLLPRESLQHVKVKGYDIPSKTRVWVNAWAIGRDPCSWDSPELFDPERFLRADSVASTRDFKGMSFELIPFGAGRRGCPAISYASQIVELGLASLLHKFDWSLPGGIMVENLDATECFGTILSRKYPLKLVAIPATAK
uniref:Cytochrome P450 n=1 Tax=Kalanchoe fedtschenkoi TaxID=63787 RepID=A0A7N0RAF5_KALFE